MWQALIHALGIDYGAPYGKWVPYDFWSGFGSDISEFALAISLVGVLYALLRRHNCHVHGCWRIGRHKVDGTEYVVCRRHHPTGAPTHEEVLQAHKEAQQ